MRRLLLPLLALLAAPVFAQENANTFTDTAAAVVGCLSTNSPVVLAAVTGTSTRAFLRIQNTGADPIWVKLSGTFPAATNITSGIALSSNEVFTLTVPRYQGAVTARSSTTNAGSALVTSGTITR